MPRVRQLCFEDFVECLVRASLEIPLPTDDEIRTSGFPDAGLFLLDLRYDDEAYEHFLETHNEAAASLSSTPPHRCVEHLLALLVRTIEEGTDVGRDDAQLSAKEMAAFGERLQGRGGGRGSRRQ